MLMVFVYLWRGQKDKAREEVAQARANPDEPVVHFVRRARDGGIRPRFA